MTSNPSCASCAHERETGQKVDGTKSNSAWAREIGISEAAIRRHKKHTHQLPSTHKAASSSTDAPISGEDTVVDKTGDSHGNTTSYTITAQRAFGYEDFRKFIEASGQDPDEVTFNWGVTTNPSGGFWNKLNNVRPLTAVNGGGPKWPVIDRAQPVVVVMEPFDTSERTLSRYGQKLTMSLKGADPQIGFRALPDGTYEEFHDERAMNVFVEVARQEKPETIVILGDFLDLAGQGKYIQEAGFARTTQMSLNFAHKWLATLRKAAPSAEIVIVEGNHDKRMQNFIELNALAAFGLTRANMPEEWPVMSLPYLLRLEELDIKYMDAYPAAVWWDDDRTRNIHGTRANSKGSTMAQYASDLPHINTWAGHTHRTEIIYKTVMGARGEAIESYSANPGALCKTDGTVPSVHGALHANGTSAKVVEDWQNGFGINLFNPATGESWPQVYRIRDGKALYNGRIIG